MCDMCDQPDLTFDAYVDRVRTLLTRERFVVESVEGSRRSAEFSYSVGLTAHGLPELIVMGLRPADAHALISSAADYLLDESVVLPGELLHWGPYVIEAVEVARPAEHLVLATVLFGESVRALQLVWADDAGIWPWQPRHRARRAGQPVLGERAPWFCDEHRPDRLDVPEHP